MKENALQWHPGFQAVLQIELQEDKEYLQFEKEYNLTEKPLQMDTLIIKLEKGHKVRKSIGRIFGRYNVVEYKSPTYYVSINDFFRVIGYACTFQSNTAKVLERSPEEITVTFAANKYPKKLIHFLKIWYQVWVEKVESGIYYLHGLMFPMQFLLIPKLTKEEYIWLSRLRENLEAEDVDCLSKAYVGKNKHPLYAAAMDLIVKANKEIYEEEKDMCQAIRELFADEFAEQVEQLAKLDKTIAKQDEMIARQENRIMQLEIEKEQATLQGISALISAYRALELSEEVILQKISETFSLNQEDAQRYMEKQSSAL